MSESLMVAIFVLIGGLFLLEHITSGKTDAWHRKWLLVERGSLSGDHG
jgi:hypothetical protein